MIGKRFPKEVTDYIAEHSDGVWSKDLFLMLQEEFPGAMTLKQIDTYRKHHHLYANVGRGKRSNSMKVFPDEIAQYIKEHYEGTSYLSMIEQIKEKFGREYTSSQIKHFYGHHHLNSGRTGRFNGSPSPYKGKHHPEWWGKSSTVFQKGNRPHNERPIGYERVCRDGYIEVKVSSDRKYNFRPKHQVVWEQHYGEIPKGHAIAFADGNKLNCDIDNLLLISKGNMMRMANNKWFTDDAELTKAGLNVARLIEKAAEKEKRNE